MTLQPNSAFPSCLVDCRSRIAARLIAIALLLLLCALRSHISLMDCLLLQCVLHHQQVYLKYVSLLYAHSTVSHAFSEVYRLLEPSRTYISSCNNAQHATAQRLWLSRPGRLVHSRSKASGEQLHKRTILYALRLTI